MSATILRTADKGCFEVYEGPWGSYIRSTFDPDANAKITDEHLKHFELKEGIHKIPADLWQAWVQLCFHFVDKVPRELEVNVRILRSEEDPSVYRMFVPRQKVSMASVDSPDFCDSVDLVTGEILESYPPEGWVPVGGSHSHNTMTCSFSSVDDTYQLKDPGIHLIVAGINVEKRTYIIYASVVGSGRRFLVDYNALVDASPVPGATFHEKVLEYIEVEKPKTYNKWLPPAGNSQGVYYNWHKNKFKHPQNQYDDKFKDPYHFQDGSIDPDFWKSYEDETSQEPLNQSDTPLWQITDSINDYFLEDRVTDLDEVASFVQMMTPIARYLRCNAQNPAAINGLASLLRSEMKNLEDSLEDLEVPTP